MEAKAARPAPADAAASHRAAAAAALKILGLHPSGAFGRGLSSVEEHDRECATLLHCRSECSTVMHKIVCDKTSFAWTAVSYAGECVTHLVLRFVVCDTACLTLGSVGQLPGSQTFRQTLFRA